MAKSSIPFKLGFTLIALTAIAMGAIVTPIDSQARGARGKREKVEKTPEARNAECLENTHGWTIMARNALNAARNPLADNVGATDWQKFCGCYAPRTAELEATRPASPSPEEKQKLMADYDQVMLECAKLAVPAGASPSSASTSPVANTATPPPPTGANDSRFAASINQCKQHPSGYLLNLEVHLKVQKSPRAETVRTMDAGKYCECYVKNHRTLLGDELALRELTSVQPLATTPDETMRLANAKNTIYNRCADEQIPFPTGPSPKIEVGASSGYEAAMKATFISGKGLAGIEINQPAANLAKVLGPTNFVSKSQGSDEYRYGPNMIELVARVMPNGPEGKIKQLTVGSQFRGRTDRGVRIGDSYATVKTKNAGSPILYEDGKSVLLYKDGMLFGFSGGLSKIAITTPEGNGLMKLHGK